MPAGPARYLRSRWRSSPRKWRNDAVPRGRGQKAPSTRRCIKTNTWLFTIVASTSVRKHLAPEGALRHDVPDSGQGPHEGQKAPRTRRCIKTLSPGVRLRMPASQKAPRTRRCVKTSGRAPGSTRSCCQKAPRTRKCIKTLRPYRNRYFPTLVRKHLAPEGALRRPKPTLTAGRVLCQKAPRTRRCIETIRRPGPQRAPRPSESTQHQKVH